VLQQFLQDFEQIALEAASKKLFSFFWRMQSSKRRFLLRKVVADSARLRADMCKREECLGGYIFFGQGRSDAKKGNMVCVPLGCDIPMLVRKNTESGLYDLIAPCYWLGVMHGEAMTALENKEVELEEFVFR
jgi:hypothetical protein